MDESIIMATAHSEHADEACELEVLNCRIKPIAFERFLKACQKALEFNQSKRLKTYQHHDAGGHFLSEATI